MQLPEACQDSSQDPSATEPETIEAIVFFCVCVAVRGACATWKLEDNRCERTPAIPPHTDLTWKHVTVLGHVLFLPEARSRDSVILLPMAKAVMKGYVPSGLYPVSLLCKALQTRKLERS